MSSTVVAMGIAGLAAGGLVATLGLASLLSGGVHFFLVRPKLRILQSRFEHGFAFGLSWNSAREPASFDQMKLNFFNAFGTPQKIEIWRAFPAFDNSAARDIDLGPELQRLLAVDGLDKASIQIEIGSSKHGVFHQFDMPARQFAGARENASWTVEKFAESGQSEQSAPAKPVYATPKRSFVADPLPPSNKVLKLATNPAFAGEMAVGQDAPAGDGAAAENQFAVSKVWIDPGCIVCDACESIYPEVFEVTDTTCVIRPDAPLHDGLKVEEAAEACPVEVIKFDKA